MRESESPLCWQSSNRHRPDGHGLAAGGWVALIPALAVIMLGANIGTTLIVQILSFNVTEVAPALILIGVMMFSPRVGWAARLWTGVDLAGLHAHGTHPIHQPALAL